ncbi:hypothetical protein [Mycolicibacterium llatzerense]|uniref:hypothetical protein n=1 Tax=Mycolicibacterium llatzerense TaxID=280871 RepID=UPI0031DF1397
MIHLFAAGAQPSLTVLAASHSTHHNIVTDVVHWVLHAVASGFGWWAGRNLAEQLGLGGIAAVVLAAGVLWLINRATGGAVTRLWRPKIGHRTESSTIRL